MEAPVVSSNIVIGTVSYVNLGNEIARSGKTSVVYFYRVLEHPELQPQIALKCVSQVLNYGVERDVLLRIKENFRRCALFPYLISFDDANKSLMMNYAGITMKMFISTYGIYLTREDWRCILFQVFYSQIFLCDFLQVEEHDSHLNNFCVDILPAGTICHHNLYFKFSESESLCLGFSSRYLVTRIDLGSCKLQRNLSSEFCKLRNKAVKLKHCSNLSLSTRSSSQSGGRGPLESRANGYLPMKYILDELKLFPEIRALTTNIVPSINQFNPVGFFSLFIDTFFPFIKPYVCFMTASDISEDTALHLFRLKNLSLINLMDIQHKQIFGTEDDFGSTLQNNLNDLTAQEETALLSLSSISTSCVFVPDQPGNTSQRKWESVSSKNNCHNKYSRCRNRIENLTKLGVSESDDRLIRARGKLRELKQLKETGDLISSNMEVEKPVSAFPNHSPQSELSCSSMGIYAFYDSYYPLVKLTASNGLGLFARKQIPTNTIITEYCGDYVLKEDLKNVPGLYRPLPGVGVGSFANSDVIANSVFCHNRENDKLFIKSSKEIEEGEEIVLNYSYF